MKNGKYKYSDGFYYYKNNEWHREDGPAIECFNGNKWWYKEGKLHRLDGPAIEYEGVKSWWIEGKRINCKSQKEFERMINLINFW